MFSCKRRKNPEILCFSRVRSFDKHLKSKIYKTIEVVFAPKNDVRNSRLRPNSSYTLENAGGCSK